MKPSPTLAPPLTTSMAGGISGIYAPESMFILSSSPGKLPSNSMPSPASVPRSSPGITPVSSTLAVKYGKPFGSF